MKSKILYTVGDSWTYGDDLKNPQIESYPYLLSKRIGCDLVNDGKNFAGNDWIFRKSVEFITSNKIEPIKPNSSENNVKIKSVCFSGK